MAGFVYRDPTEALRTALTKYDVSMRQRNQLALEQEKESRIAKEREKRLRWEVEDRQRKLDADTNAHKLIQDVEQDYSNEYNNPMGNVAGRTQRYVVDGTAATRQNMLSGLYDEAYKKAYKKAVQDLRIAPDNEEYAEQLDAYLQPVVKQIEQASMIDGTVGHKVTTYDKIKALNTRLANAEDTNVNRQLINDEINRYKTQLEINPTEADLDYVSRLQAKKDKAKILSKYSSEGLTAVPVYTQTMKTASTKLDKQLAKIKAKYGNTTSVDKNALNKITKQKLKENVDGLAIITKLKDKVGSRDYEDTIETYNTLVNRTGLPADVVAKAIVASTNTTLWGNNYTDDEKVVQLLKTIKSNSNNTSNNKLLQNKIKELDAAYSQYGKSKEDAKKAAKMYLQDPNTKFDNAVDNIKQWIGSLNTTDNSSVISSEGTTKNSGYKTIKPPKTTKGEEGTDDEIVESPEVTAMREVAKEFSDGVRKLSKDKTTGNKIRNKKIKELRTKYDNAVKKLQQHKSKKAKVVESKESVQMEPNKKLTASEYGQLVKQIQQSTKLDNKTKAQKIMNLHKWYRPDVYNTVEKLQKTRTNNTIKARKEISDLRKQLRKTKDMDKVRVLRNKIARLQKTTGVK